MKTKLFNFQVEIDEKATKDWYATADEWNCECGDCRNFLSLAHKRYLPAPVIAILDHFHIPPEKATYVCKLYSDKDGFCYQFSYRIAGRIISGNEQLSVTQNWGCGRCCHESYPYGAPGFPEPHFDVEFSMTLPWILDTTKERSLL